MQRKNYKMKKIISMKQFISEFGENFSEHMKERLMELEIRCVLSRKEEENILDLKHVEHTKFSCDEDGNSGILEKEYAYGQFIVTEGLLYFSEKCIETDEVMQSPIVSTIYNSLDDSEMILFNETKAKQINDSNIDYLIDTVLEVYPQVSKKYMDILNHMNAYTRK